MGLTEEKWIPKPVGLSPSVKCLGRSLASKECTPKARNPSLRQAQLEIFKNPSKIPELANGFRGKFEVVPGTGGEVAIKPTMDGMAHPLHWAAFTISGPGR